MQRAGILFGDQEDKVRFHYLQNWLWILKLILNNDFDILDLLTFKPGYQSQRFYWE